MSDAAFWSWLALLLLGAWHGINPAMGWLFAVALGLQERNRRAVWGALVPLALGHGLAIGGAILLAGLVGLIVPVPYLKSIVAATLLVFGVYRLLRGRHPRWVGMRVGMWDLTVWSWLMASAHGAGLMVLPFVLGLTAHPVGAGHEASELAAQHGVRSADLTTGPGAVAWHPTGHGAHASALLPGLPDGQLVGVVATLVHTAGYLLITGVLAVLVYEKLGLRFLRTAWLNLDRIWGTALILTAVLTPLV